MGGSKKAPPTYVANVDLMIGSNPMQGVLQVWNNATKYPLIFTSYRVSAVGVDTVTIPDAHFYMVVAVTAELVLAGTFNDYGGGTTPWSGTYELPLWNAAQAGPDLIDPGFVKLSNFKWAPADGAVVNTVEINSGNPPGGQGNPYGAWNGFINIYYAKTDPAFKNQVPITFARLTFEPVLGDGPEYTGYAGQQILYPEYCGAGSPNIDLGSGPALPVLKPEVLGSFPFFKTGDAQFADIIEDIFKAGQLQVGSQLGVIQRGLNCNELPGPIQSNFLQYLVSKKPAVPYWSPNAVGNMLVAFGKFQYAAGAGVQISDAPAGNTWTAVYQADNGGAFYATAIASDPGTTVTFGNNSNAAAIWGSGVILELDPGSTVFDSSVVVTGAGTDTVSMVATITVTGEPTYVVGWYNCQSAGGPTSNVVGNLPPQWTKMFTRGYDLGTAVFSRVFLKPGTYTITIPRTSTSSPWALVLMGFKQVQPVNYPKTLGRILDPVTLDNVRDQCSANSLYGSLSMSAQRAASDWLNDLYKCADADPVWSGFKLKSIARSEISAVGNGAVFIAPTANGPVAVLTEDDLDGDHSGPLITVTRKAQVDSMNVLGVQYFDRDNDYNTSSASEPLSGAVTMYGPRKESPIDLPMLQDPVTARKILAIDVRRQTLLRNVYGFKAKPNWIGLEAKDFILINDALAGIVNVPVLLTKVEETEDSGVQCEAEPFGYGINAPNVELATAVTPGGPGTGGDPGTVNDPVIFEPPPRLLAKQNQPEIWCGVSGADPNYGGCFVMLSTDGGASYRNLGTINSNATMGVTVGTWPAAADPDTTNDLDVDLTESLGTLETLSAADRDNFVFPCYVEGGNACIPYELMSYDIATLTAAHKYTLVATGGGTNELRRAVFACPAVGQGVSHSGGSKFLLLAPGGVLGPLIQGQSGIFRIEMDTLWIGQTLHFKFPAFNKFGNSAQALADATDYPYTPTGCPTGSQNPNNNYVNAPAVSLSETSTVLISMVQTSVQFPSNVANYNARTFAIPAPTPGTPVVYYVTILDTAQLGDTGALTNLTAYCETSDAKVGIPGYTYMGFVQATNPTSDPLQVDGPGGWPPPQLFIIGP